MNKIDINEALYGTLKKDYETHKTNEHYQSQLQSGFDYMEAMVKLFGTISISIVKEIDHDVYKNIFTENFKLTPSLGDFKSLTTKSFPQVPKKKKEKALALKVKLENKNIIYDFLQILFNTKKEIEIVDVNSLLNDEVSQKTIESVWDLLENYVVSFRNKLKGHGASFKNDDTAQRELLLNNLDKTIQYLESAYDEIYNTLEFYLLEDDKQLGIQHKDSNTTYKLLPIVAYIECDKFSCSKKHKTKLFFYNDGQKTKSHYIDYSYNHFHQITQTNEINENIKKLQEEVLHSSSDTLRQSHLLTNFVGRKKELKETKEHILSSIQDTKASFFCVMGTPGIGKSAFLTQLQQNIIDDASLNKEINSYTFYAQKDKMGGLQEEDKELWKKISGYFDKHSISIKQEGEFQLKENLEKLFSAYEDSKETKPLILIIDGLDEFANPADMIRKIPLNFTQKIHLVFSSRPYANIKNALTAKFAEIEQINILHKQSLLTEGYSIQLDKLQLGEVEELLSHVLSKEIPRESTEYEEIVQTIAEKSESVPLYIHYITQELKEKNITDAQNITQEIMNWAKQLPPKLDRFYIDRFKQTSSLARKILSMLLFSHSSVSKEDFYTVLKAIAPQEFKDKEQKEIDEVAFVEKHFNDIEVFLSIDADTKYSFYHLSVKEQLIEYYKELGQIFTYNKEKLKDVFFKSMVEYHSEMIDSMLYLKKNSDIYNLLVGLTEEVNSEDTPTYYRDNYFHILNTLIWSNIYISQINHEDMKNEQYDALLQATQLSQQSQKEVQNFFTLFNDKEQKHLFEIRYAYELALIAEDYDSVLVYKDIYENHVQEMFLDIALNIDKPEYIQKFIEYKDDWNGAVNTQVQDILINIINQQETLDDSFYDVLLFLSDEHKEILTHKISVQKALEIVRSIEYDSYKSETLTTIIHKTDNIKFLSKALEIAKNIEYAPFISKIIILIVSKTNSVELLSEALEITKSIEDKTALAFIVSQTDTIKQALKIAENIEGNSEALASIASKTNDIEQALKIAENIIDQECQSDTLASIISKTVDVQLLSKALKIAKTMRNDYYKSTVLVSIVSKTDDVKFLVKVLETVEENIIEDMYKSDALASIVSKIDNIELLSKALQIIRNIAYYWYRPKALASLASKTNDVKFLAEALEIAESIEDDRSKSYALVSIVSQTDNIEQALEIAGSIEDDRSKSYALVSIVSKTNDVKFLSEILAMIRNINNDEYKSKVLSHIAIKTDDLRLLSKILETTKYIEINEYKSKGLASIASRTDDIKQALGVVKGIVDKKDQSDTLVSIISKTTDTKLLLEALEIAGTIGINSTTLLTSIISKTDDIELLSKALDIVRSIEYDPITSIIITLTVSKTNNVELLSKALEIAGTILDDYSKSTALASIVSKLDNTKQALEIAESIQDNLEILASIASKTDDKKLFSETLEKARNIEYNESKSMALVSIVSQTDNIEQALEIAESIEDNWYKSEALVSIVSKTDDVKLLSKVLKIAGTMWHDSSKSTALVSIVSKTDDVEFLAKALEVARSIKDDSATSEVLVAIATKTDDAKLLSEILKIAGTIEIDKDKSKALASIASKTNDIKQALKITRGIEDDEYKSEALTSISSKTNDTKLLYRALEIARDIEENDRNRSEILISIASQTDDPKLLSRILDISIPSSNTADLFNKINHNIATGILYKKLFNTHIQVIQTMEIITEVSPNAILRYYGIFFDNEDSPFSSLLQQLENLLVSDLEKREKRKEFQTIKDQLVQEKNLLESFISLYGKALEIEDEDDFDDEFTYKALETIIDVIKSEVK